MDIKNVLSQMTNKSPKETVSLRDLALIKSRLSAEKAKYLDLAKLPEGTKLKGEVLDVKQDLCTILTNKGQIFNGKLNDNLPINIGENRDFVVTNKNGNMSLSLIDKPQSEIQGEKVLNTLKELGLKADPKNIEIANKLINNKMPINKETMQQVRRGAYFFENSENKQNTMQKSVFLSKNNIPPTKENAETLNNINSKENTLPKNLNEIFQKINNLPDKKMQGELKELFKPLQDNIANKDNSKTIEQKTELQKEIATKEAIVKNENNTENIQNKSTNILLNNNKNILKDTNSLEKALEKGESVPKESDKAVDFKNGKDKNFFELKNNPKEVEEDLNQLKSKVDNALKTLDKSSDEASNALKGDLKALSNKLDFYNDVNKNTFVQIPLTMNGEQREASINVFKDKKTKKHNDDYVTALVSIFTDNLGLFGTYIQKDKRKLNLQFRLEDKETEVLVQKNIGTLKGILKPLNYTIENISFKNIADTESKNNIEVLEMDILEISEDVKPIIFDKKG